MNLAITLEITICVSMIDANMEGPNQGYDVIIVYTSSESMADYWSNTLPARRLCAYVILQ